MFLNKFKLVTSVALLSTCSALGWSQNLIKVYVQAGSGDFAANGATDSALDLKKALLGKARTLQVAESPADADVIVRVDSRNTRKETASINTYANQSKDGKSTSATTVPTERTINVLQVTLMAGEFQTPLKAESSISWRFAASDMASNVDHWVKENYAKLIERRTGGATGSNAAAAASVLPPESSDASKTGSKATTSKAEESSISVGMSETQVLDAIGAPDKKVNFGKKSLWNYRGMQVVFEDGKVTDVKF